MMVYCVNSVVGFCLKKGFFNVVRFGIGMYGFCLLVDIMDEILFELYFVFILYLMLFYVKLIRKGESVSYGVEYIVEKDIWIGMVFVGYVDGWF